MKNTIGKIAVLLTALLLLLSLVACGGNASVPSGGDEQEGQKSGAEEQVVDGVVPLVLTAGETCWLRFEEKGKMP